MLLGVKEFVDGDFEVSTQTDVPIIFSDNDNRGSPLSKIDPFNNILLLKPVKLLTNLGTNGVWYGPGWHTLRNCIFTKVNFSMTIRNTA